MVTFWLIKYWKIISSQWPYKKLVIIMNEFLFYFSHSFPIQIPSSYYFLHTKWARGFYILQMIHIGWLAKVDLIKLTRPPLNRNSFSHSANFQSILSKILFQMYLDLKEAPRAKIGHRKITNFTNNQDGKRICSHRIANRDNLTFPKIDSKTWNSLKTQQNTP